ncbi:HPP family protein, partial [Oleiphilus sp. HI0080]|uniref:CBS domain-containing protein n=1 Tax=Oleiphilus sp. HI0080 TaxID=1822255 RepID=UPI000A5A9E8A
AGSNAKALSPSVRALNDCNQQWIFIRLTLQGRETVTNNSLTAKDIMTPNVKSVPQSWTMERFKKFLSDNDIIGSPVANEDGQIVGIATLKDIAEFHFDASSSQYEGEMSEEEQQEVRRLRMMIFEGLASMPVEVGDIMTPSLVSVQENTAVKDVAELMMNEHLHRVFVKNGDEVSGIITTYDLLKIIVEQLS